jgi:hypothetical protein
MPRGVTGEGGAPVTCRITPVCAQDPPSGSPAIGNRIVDEEWAYRPLPPPYGSAGVVSKKPVLRPQWFVEMESEAVRDSLLFEVQSLWMR